MLKATPKILALVLILLASCIDDETGSILHRIKLYENGDLLTERTILHDEAGRVIQISQKDINNPGVNPYVTDFEYTEDQISFHAGAVHNYF